MSSIAIYLSGRVNGYTDNIIQLKHFFKNKSIFISFNTNEKNEFMKTFYECNLICSNSLFSKDIVDFYLQYNRYPEVNIYNCLSMFYHNKLAFELIEREIEKKNKHYSVVIKYRGDIQSNSDFPLLLTVEKNTIYIPEGCDWRDGINDQIAYGDYISMKKYSHVFDNIKDYCQEGIILHPETLLKHHLKVNHLKIKRFKFDYSLNEKRKNIL
jgi:hypothetical protein